MSDRKYIKCPFCDKKRRREMYFFELGGEVICYLCWRQHLNTHDDNDSWRSWDRDLRSDRTIDNPLLTEDL